MRGLLWYEKKTALAAQRPQELLFYYEAMGSASLEDVLETKLDNARIDCGAINLPERAVPQRSVGIPELRVIKGIVKFRPELECMAFAYGRVLDNRDIPVKLTGTASNTSSRIAPPGAIAIDPAGWRRAECAGVRVAGATAFPAQPFTNTAGRRD